MLVLERHRVHLEVSGLIRMHATLDRVVCTWWTSIFLSEVAQYSTMKCEWHLSSRVIGVDQQVSILTASMDLI